MTTLVAINTRDGVVMGSDSLGTMVKSLVDPGDLTEYFDVSNGAKIRISPDGRPVLGDLSQITARCHEVTCSHLTNVDKIFFPASAGNGCHVRRMAFIGDRSVKSLYRRIQK